jgi:hypothetical protein
MQKVYTTEDRKTTLACPACERSRTVDVSAYVKLARPVQIKIKCPCGHHYPASLERRRHFRKAVNLKGTLSPKTGDQPGEQGRIAVKDLSRTGMRIRMAVDRRIRVGDRLMVEFQLDDHQRSTICRESIVRRVDGLDLGTEFIPAACLDPGAKAMGFYLLP